jgi:hypothetical protein
MSSETLAGIAVPLTGAGVVLLALAPLALPIIILTIVATVPLILVGLVVALVVSVIAAPFVLVRRLLAGRDERPRRPVAQPPASSTTRWSTNRSRTRIPRAS